MVTDEPKKTMAQQFLEAFKAGTGVCFDLS